MKATQITATFVFIMGGISKAGKPYLQVSNGRDTFFLTMPARTNITESTFSDYNPEDEITLKVTTRIGSAGATYNDVVAPK